MLTEVNIATSCYDMKTLAEGLVASLAGAPSLDTLAIEFFLCENFNLGSVSSVVDVVRRDSFRKLRRVVLLVRVPLNPYMDIFQMDYAHENLLQMLRPLQPNIEVEVAWAARSLQRNQEWTYPIRKSHISAVRAERLTNELCENSPWHWARSLVHG
jgi:hypothetical protein